jgi:hypothetical protein
VILVHHGFVDSSTILGQALHGVTPISSECGRANNGLVDDSPVDVIILLDIAP